MAANAVPDRHVHSEWSWDAPYGDMLATCRRAAELGLPAIALTEHADFTPYAHGPVDGGDGSVRVIDNSAPNGWLDIAGYWECLDRCRRAVPEICIESGIELGEAHRFPDATAKLLNHRPLDRVLGSIHCIEIGGVLMDVSTPGVLQADEARARMRQYLIETLDLVESGIPFAILTHLDYPKRYWPHAEVPFDELDYEDEYRAVLRGLAASGRILEINSFRGTPAPRAPNPGERVVRWWHELGGQAVSFGSDAHRPEHVAVGLREAAEIATAAGFKAGTDTGALWTRL